MLGRQSVYFDSTSLTPSAMSTLNVSFWMDVVVLLEIAFGCWLVFSQFVPSKQWTVWSIKYLLLRIILFIPFLVEWIIRTLVHTFSRILRNIIGAGITIIHGFGSLLYYFILVPSNFSDLVHNFSFNYSQPSSLARRDVLEWPGLPSVSCSLIQEGEPDVAGPGVLSSAFWH